MKKLTSLVIFLFLILPTMEILAESPDIPKIENNPYETRAREALETIVKEQVEKIKEISNSTNSENEKNIKGYVLTTHIRSFSDLPNNIDAEIKQVRERIKLLIRRVATDIEISGGSTGSLTVEDDGYINYKPNPNIPKKLNERREQLLKANIENSVSVRSAAMAIHLLAGINDDLKVQADKAKTRQQKEKIYMIQASYVYEMADIVLELLGQMTLEGKATIENLHQDAKVRVNNRVNDIEQLLNRAMQLKETGLMTDQQIIKEEETYSLMKRANKKSLDAWNELILIIGKQQDFLNNLKRKKSIIEYKREKARVQLETLRDLRQVAELRDGIGGLDDLVASVSSLDLLVLDELTVRSLLGYNIDQ